MAEKRCSACAHWQETDMEHVGSCESPVPLWALDALALEALDDFEWLGDKLTAGSYGEECPCWVPRDEAANGVLFPGAVEHADTRTAESDSDDEANFDFFWKAYPKRKAKRQAKKAWDKSRNRRPPIGTLLTILDAQKHSVEWEKDGGAFIPLPATWLNGDRWEDEFTPSKTSPTNYSQEVARYE